MHADYVPNPLYDNNPFIEALPPMLSGKDLIRALAVIPPYSDSDRDRSTGERLQLLSSLYEFYQPLSMTIDLYCEIYTAMQHCYGQYSIQSEAAAMQNGYSLMHGNALAASVGGGNSFSVIGVSGLGKSTALQRVFLRNLGMVSEYISELSTKSVAKRQTKTAPEVSVGSAAPTKIVGNDIRALLKKAKKNGESPVSAYAEYIKGEVAI